MRSIEEEFKRQRLRIEKRNSLYKKWREKAKPLLAKAFENNIDFLLDYKLVESRRQHGGSFWDFPAFYTKVIQRKDGRYYIESGPGYKEDYGHYYEIDDSSGQGYNLNEVCIRFSGRVLNEVIKLDSLGLYESYDALVKRILTHETTRNQFIKKIKDKTGVDIR